MIYKILRKLRFFWANVLFLIIHKPSLGLALTQRLGPIGLAVLAFFGYKHLDREVIYI